MAQVFIGYDPREAAAFAVTRHSIRRTCSQRWPIKGLVLDDLRASGLYTRPTETRDGKLWDVISNAPMATEFSISRFLVPYLAQEDWALFTDCDMLVRGNFARQVETLDRRKAVYCVQHNHTPSETVKMDGQIQTRYARKNWSSLMWFNASHPANKSLTPDLVNSLPGRDLHRFCWLDDDEIGELDPSWNFLVGHTDPAITPNCIHFTDGVPNMPGYENVQYADLWREELAAWAR